ncbi:separase [Magnolia sinica]|uniref:separase n=1 Tax=Magnolia sinica TaxID=86752 RepID=UPI00265A2917|nr:separase [Magnolia sinica]
MYSDTESSLIETLETSYYVGLYDRFSSFLGPFSDLISMGPTIPQNKTKKKKKKEIDPTRIRALAKQFLPFISRILKLIPDRANSIEGDENALELFKIYRLALDCLSCISSCIAGIPYTVHMQRARFVRCLEGRGRYDEAENEGFLLLESLRMVVPGNSALKAPKGRKAEVCFLPDPPMAENADQELAALVLDVVLSIVKCVSKGGSKDGGPYLRVLDLVRQAAPWLRVLDSEASEKSHRGLVSALYRCTLFVAGQCTRFNGDLVHRFCMTTLTECLVFSMKDQFPKLARRICSSLSLQWEGRSSLILDILSCTVESIYCECKADMVCVVNEFLDFVYYCANSCRIAKVEISRGAATHLKETASDVLQVLPPIASILSLYAVGLYLTDSDAQAGHQDSIPEKAFSTLTLLLDDGVILQHLAASLFLLASHVHDSGNDNGLISSHAEKSSKAISCFATESSFELPKSCKHMHGEVSLPSYLKALDFLCKPFAEYVNTAWKHMVSETGFVCFPANVKYVQDAFHQFCEVFLTGFSSTSERERERLNESRGTLFHVAIAAFRISLWTDGNTQKSADCIGRVISKEWVQPQEMKFLMSSLYNIGVSLYNIKQFEQASTVLELCHRALWLHVSLACQKFSNKADGVCGDDDLSEDAIVDIITDACTKSAIYLDVLHQSGSSDMNRVIVNSLINWSVASKSLKKLTSPMVLVKRWVKIMCKDFEDINAEDNCSSLYSLLLSCCATWSKTMLGIILEQELLAYAEMDARNPNLCQSMQLKIIDTLLIDIYVTEDHYLQRSRVLVRKGRLLRASGIDGLNSCLHFLSEAISILNNVCSESSIGSTSLCHQLALAYCLHALCTQEADQNSEVILHDIRFALKLWTSLTTPGHWSWDDLPELAPENAILLLYHVADLLSLKGYLHFHYDIYKLIINICKWKNVPLERCLAMLWGDRRLNHALCMLPIDETFILNLSQQFGVHINSIDYWISCMESSPSSLLGFCQKFLLPDSSLPQVGRCYTKRSLGPDVTVDKIKEAAAALVCSVPVRSHLAFVAGYLYYDLCERLISNARLFEALSYAREALRLRVILLQRKFVPNFGQQSTKAVETVEQNMYDRTHLVAVGSVVTEVWPDIIRSHSIECAVLSPWNILQCYLESTLQVGIVHESIGNAADAEALLLMGKKISCLQGLPIFIVAFASLLGRIYCKKQLWDQAENELNNAKQVLVDRDAVISCKRCKLAWEVTIDAQIGDLIRSRVDMNRSIQSLNHSPHFLELYRSALEKLDLVEPENPISFCEKTNTESIMFGKILTEDDRSQVNVDSKKSRKSKNTVKQLEQKQNLKAECNSRRTLTTNRSSRTKNIRVEGEVDCEFPSCSDQVDKLARPVANIQKGQQLELNSCSAADFDCELIEAGSMRDIIHLKWECHRRRLSLRLLTKMGKCMKVHSKIHEVHKIFWQGISVLFNRNPFCQSYSDNLDMLEFIGKENPGDIFAVERAEILYNICWLSVKNSHPVHPRIRCCNMSDIQISRIVPWLLQAFVLCRELPALIQKVSRLLATIFLLSTLCESFSLPLYTGKALSANHWAAYFHQASLGTYLHHQYLFGTRSKSKAFKSMAAEVSCGVSSEDITLDGFDSLRVAPEKVEELEGFVRNFCEGLPSVTVVCITLLGGDYGSLLGQILLLQTSFPAWMLLSRLDVKQRPVVMLLPVDLVHEETQYDNMDYGVGSVSEASKLTKKWVCPWRCTVVDDVAPQFKLILEENYLSTLPSDPAGTQINTFTWWTRRTKLNERLENFLRGMEESWLGSWRCLLLGKHSNHKHLDTVLTKFMGDLKHKSKFEAHENLLKAILGGAKSVAEAEECVSELLLYKGYFGSGGCCVEERFGPFSSSGGVGTVDGLARQLILEAIGEFSEEEIDREPVVLVLDADVQMLPWENLPILRKQEVYRMPSVGSISAALNRSQSHQAQVGRVAATFPSIDPMDAYYLLNPSGDLSFTQVEFEEWFQNHNLKGKAGNVPTTEELASALQEHDLFIYFGHGSGIQYIPRYEIQKLDCCAATLLMGCSSGALLFTGRYAPQGAPLSYLLAGSPAIIANLWDVTDRDIDRFGRVMLDGWMQEESSPQMSCPKCSQIAKELRSMDVCDKGNDKRPKTRRKVARGKEKLQEACCSCRCRDCGEKLRIASVMSQARDACKLPFLIGASPVCYGVPTIIRKRQL